MKKTLARLLRSTANRLDPVLPYYDYLLQVSPETEANLGRWLATQLRGTAVRPRRHLRAITSHLEER